ncbi:MAG TPA: hypothetical protein VFA50_10140 [Stellaceae bacterium]|nr:hypothetical protein [Stellaceae bacterium]
MYEEFRARVAGTTIDSGTLLSTDYFNSVNEIIMLIGMVPDMPEMIEDVRAWRFRSYEEHFRGSGLAFAPLAIEAYAHVPPATRDNFEHVLEELRATVEEARQKLATLAGAAEPERLKLSAADYSLRLQSLVDTGSAIVHGGADRVSDQDAIDKMF